MYRIESIFLLLFNVVTSVYNIISLLKLDSLDILKTASQLIAVFCIVMAYLIKKGFFKINQIDELGVKNNARDIILTNCASIALLVAMIFNLSN